MHIADVGGLYDGYHAVGLEYGPGYRTLVQAWGGASDAAARLRARATRQGTQVHPADLDDALCTGDAMRSSGGGGVSASASSGAIAASVPAVTAARSARITSSRS